MASPIRSGPAFSLGSQPRTAQGLPAHPEDTRSALVQPFTRTGYPLLDVVAIVTGALSVLLGVVFLAFPLVFTGGMGTHFSLAVMGCAFVAMGLSRPALARCLALPTGLVNLAIFVGYIKYGPPGLDTVIITALWPEAPKIWGGNLNADLAYALTAIAILLLTEPGWKFRWRSTAIVLTGSAILGLGVLGLSRYLTGLGTAYGLRRLISAQADSIVGVLLLGAGLLAISWRKGRHVSAERHAWLLAVVAMSGVVVSTSLWQALMLVEELPINSTQQFRSYVERIVLTFGALATVLLAVAVAFVQKLRNLNDELERRVQKQTTELLARRQAEQDLARANAYNRSLIEVSIDPLVTIGADGKITDVNAATESATGRSRQELIGTDFCDYFTNPEEARAGYQQAFREGGVRDYALELRHRDSRFTPVLYNASVYHDQAGNVIGVFAAARDVSERRRAELALRCSEERYRALVLASAQVVWTTTPEGVVEDMPMWRKYTGQSLEQVRGWGWLDAVHADDREPTAAIWRKAVETGGLYETEYRIRRADGQYRHFVARGVPVLNDNGSIREWVGICTDIHERKQIEDEMRKQAALLNLAHDAVMAFDLQYRIVFWNRGAEETYGWSAKEAIGRVAPELLHTQFAVPLPQIRAVVYQKGEWDGEITHLTRDGRSIVVESRWSLQRDHHGIPTNILEICRDITQRKKLEDSLRQRTGELENAVAELEAFSYSVSHDLRAPLRSIDGFSHIVLDEYRDKVDAEGQDCLRRIRLASQNMGQLIDALLQLSRVMRGELLREPVDLSMLALSTAAVVHRTEPSRRVRFHIASGLQVPGDRRLLGVLLQNLLQNAWKFTAHNPEPLIEFGSTHKDGKTAYYVRDNGVGFDMTYVNKLFTPFQRLHARDQFDGTGIGLATVKRIIKRHAGQVWAEGAVGKGATFYFTLE